MTAELYHRIGDEPSAAARRRVMELGLKDRVDFRNVDFESHAKELADRGGAGAVPALWDGASLHEGLAAVLAALDALAR